MEANLFKLVDLGILVVALILVAAPVQAITTIDFEGFTDLTALGSITTANNVVTFSVGAPVGSPGSQSAYIAQVGSPQTSFVPLDTPAGATAGSYFLTDEQRGPNLALDYYIEFENPVSAIGLDLYDYRVDGGPTFGSAATLTVYSDMFTTPIGTDSYTVTPPNPIDGNIEHLAVINGSFNIMSASIAFDLPDIGTGIDNIRFIAIPAPTSIILGTLGAALVGWFRKRKII